MFIKPNPKDADLTRKLRAMDHKGQSFDIPIVEERPLTIFLNNQEIVTAMTIGDYPKLLALGFLHNQGMLENLADLQAVDYDEDLATVVVRTKSKTDYEEKLKKKTQTSGCAVGTVFGDMMDALETVALPKAQIHERDMFALSRKINQMPSLYLEAGAIHGSVLCEGDEPLVYFEDVGRHNAVDKTAGWILQNRISTANKTLYTTGRLTSEMVIKTARMGIPILMSRSGFTAWGVDLAQKTGMTLIGRLRGERYMILSGYERLIRERA